MHSLAHALAMFNVKMSFVSPPELKMPEDIIEDLKNFEVEINETSNLNEVIDDIDVLYVTRIQKERFPDPQEYSRIKGAYNIDAKTLEGKDLIVMHPLPRVDEISYEVDNLPCAKYFKQAFYGVPVRMAILKLLIK